MRQIIGWVVIAVLAALGGGCASSAPTTSPVDSSRDLTEMKERILELQEQAAMAEVEIDRLRQELDVLRRQVGAGTAGAALGQAQPPAVQTGPETIEAPIGNTAPVTVESSDLEPAPVTSSALDTLAGETEAAQMPAPLPTPPTGQMEAVDPAAQALYDRGYTLYHQGKYLDAEASFQRFLQAYPMTELSDNAQFWIGESRYARGDIRGALGAFREVVQNYPEGNKVADSMIKEGDCLDKLGDRDGARDRYGEVMRRFPDSAAAVVAEDRLAGLD